MNNRLAAYAIALATLTLTYGGVIALPSDPIESDGEVPHGKNFFRGEVFVDSIPFGPAPDQVSDPECEDCDGDCVLGVAFVGLDGRLYLYDALKQNLKIIDPRLHGSARRLTIPGVSIPGSDRPIIPSDGTAGPDGTVHLLVDLSANDSPVQNPRFWIFSRGLQDTAWTRTGCDAALLGLGERDWNSTGREFISATQHGAIVVFNPRENRAIEMRRQGSLVSASPISKHEFHGPLNRIDPIGRSYEARWDSPGGSWTSGRLYVDRIGLDGDAVSTASVYLGGLELRGKADIQAGPDGDVYHFGRSETSFILTKLVFRGLTK